MDSKKEIKQFLEQQNIPSDKQYGVCRMFMTDRAQYPTKTPASWGAVVNVISERQIEFKNYIESGVDYKLMENLGIYGV